MVLNIYNLLFFGKNLFQKNVKNENKKPDLCLRIWAAVLFYKVDLFAQKSK